MNRRRASPKASATIAGGFLLSDICATLQGSAQHERNDPADAQGLHFEPGFDGSGRSERTAFNRGAMNRDAYGRTGRQPNRISFDLDAVPRVKPKRPGVHVLRKLYGQDAHSDQVRPMNAFETRGQN